MRKVNFEVDVEQKNQIINGEHDALLKIVYGLKKIFEQDTAQDSLEMANDKNAMPNQKQGIADMHQHSLAQSNFERSAVSRKSINGGNVNSNNQEQQSSDLLEYVLDVIGSKLKLTRKQAIALIAQNNKYLAHVYVKGIKGTFQDVEAVLQKFYQDNEKIVGMMLSNNEMCNFYLQLVKPALLSKSEDIALWACRIFSRLGLDLANNDLLPVAYEWLIRENGGLATTILALTRHPKLSQSAVGFILQFGRYNVSDLFTVELRKFTADNIAYLKFVLLIFNSLIESKISSEEILSSGALDYWIELAEKGADSDYRNSIEMRIVSIELLIRIWKAYPIHIEQTLNLVNNILNYIKKGIREDNNVLRFTLLELLFDLLNYFASLKNPYASILYKKMTFMFIENHENVDVRENVLANFRDIFKRFQSIPVEIFMEPFIKQLKVSEGKTYILNVFDMEFVKAASEHRKLKVRTAIDLFDFLAKIFLNDHVFTKSVQPIMEYLVDRFMDDESFVSYTIKLVKISLAIFFSSLKKRPTNKTNILDDATRLAMQKRAQIINFIIFLSKKECFQLNNEIKTLAVHLRIQVVQNYKIQHKGIIEILKMFGEPYEVQKQVLAANQAQPAEEDFEVPDPNRVVLPRINSRNSNRDEIASQHSFNSRGTGLSKGTSRQEFPMKDYQQFETDQEKKFMQQHGIGLKKNDHSRNVPPEARQKMSVQKLDRRDPRQKKDGSSKNDGYSNSGTSLAEGPRNFKITKNKEGGSSSSASNNIKVMEYIENMKERKEEEQTRKLRQQEMIDKKKQLLKEKIKKQLQQRNLALGKAIPGQKNKEAKVIFQDNEINEKLFEDAEVFKGNPVRQEEDRDEASINITLKKYDKFLRKLFTRYSNASSLKKKDTFEEDSAGLMSHIDLIRMFKQKNIEKNKTILQDIIKIAQKKDTPKGPQALDYEGFLACLQQYAILSYSKEKVSVVEPMGAYLKDIIKKLSVGENSKLEEDEDETSRDLTIKLKQDPQTQIPANYKKITEKNFLVSRKLTPKVSNSLPEKYAVCYSIISDILNQKLKCRLMENNVEVKEETKVVKKMQLLPPKPNQTNTKKDIPLLQEVEKPPVQMKRQLSESKNIARPIQRQNSERKRQPVVASRSVEKGQKIVNAAQRKKLQEEEQQQKKQAQEEEHRKKRALEVKKKLQQQQNQLKQQREKKKEEEKEMKQKEEERLKKEKENKEQYLKQQKQKIEKHKKEQEEKEKEAKRKKQEQEKKTEQLKKENIKKLKQKEEEKRKEEEEAMKKKKQKDEEELKNKKMEEEKKKEAVKKQAQKLIEADKEKKETEKNVKETIKKLYAQPVVAKVFNNYKDQLKALHAYGLEFNDFQIGQAKNTCIEQKGWIHICQAFALCDINSATMMIKTSLRERQEKGISYQAMQEILLGLAIKNNIQKNSDNYQNLKNYAVAELQKYINWLEIPREKVRQKQLFLNMKKGYKKPGPTDKQGGQLEDMNEEQLQKVEEMQVVNPEGKKQKWGMK